MIQSRLRSRSSGSVTWDRDSLGATDLHASQAVADPVQAFNIARMTWAT